MKPTPDTQPIPIESDELNEIELQAPEASDGVTPAPEGSLGTEEMTAWDETTDSGGRRMPVLPLESEDTITEQLVNTGNEEADLEQREAAGEAGEDR